MILTESKVTTVLTEGLRYHLQTGNPLYENIYRPGSEEYFNTIRQARLLMNEGLLQNLCLEDMELLFETQVGEYAEFEGKKVPLDFPMLGEITFTVPTGEATWKKASELLNPQITKLGEKRWKEEAGKFKVNDGLGYVTQYSQIQGVIQNLAPSEEVEFSDSDIVPMPVVVKYFENEAVKYDLIAGEDTLSSLISSGIDTDPDIFVVDLTDLEEKERITEAKYQGKEVALNKPKRGGPKKFFVYTRNPKTGKTIKVNFGGTTGLTAKINNPEARRNFASRHNCDQKNDKTKPGYWSCRLPRYAKLIGLKSSFGGFW
jgi:hypothetical protein